MRRLGNAISLRVGIPPVNPEPQTPSEEADLDGSSAEISGGAFKKRFTQRSRMSGGSVTRISGALKKKHKMHDAIKNIKEQISPLVPASTEGGAFYPTGYKKGSGFEPTGETLGGGFDVSGAGFDVSGGALRKAVERVTDLIKDILPPAPIEVELKPPASPGGFFPDSPKHAAEALEGGGKNTSDSYTSALQGDMSDLKNQLGNFADIIAREIVSDLTENLEQNEGFRSTLAKIIMTFTQMAEERPDTINSELQAARAKTKLKKVSGGKITTEGVKRFFNRAGSAIKSAGEFVYNNRDTIGKVAGVLAPLLL